MIAGLSEADRTYVADMDARLAEEQSTKENDEAIACLPSLQMEDIPLEKPVYKVCSAYFNLSE